MSPTRGHSVNRGAGPEVDRILKEKEELMSMGYTLDDPVIIDMERQIRAS